MGTKEKTKEHFTIGEKIKPNENPINKYKLVVSNMSGDADAYEETETLFKKDDEEVLKELMDLLDWSISKHPSRDEIEKKYEKIKKNHARFFFEKENSDDEDCDSYEEADGDFEDYKEYLDETYPIVTGDSCSDGQYIARPELTSLTWFDENGEEFEVKFKK